ncbi:plasmid mobilization relaxosome protein MobC [Maribellus comscasis]|uniref:Plasmid mobilization relaxosome protein MobC n=1 Tax=Maribellus comscasis TaxID=2681766 RepID=A0A6I6JUS0_9BACT|nr:plasmid mobilization relaxosome protein MobC [Maribellus comscasis]QGY46281.1 plasmid mobilization relaxosome protein MobC [Maribellus comscasis]
MKTIKNRNSNGRPAKKPSEKKGYKITVKMATEEYYSMKAKAGLVGINRSEFIRQCIRSTVIKQRLSPELMRHIRQLSGMANNVNQIARTANAAGYIEVHNHCLIMSERLDKVIKRIEDDC